MFSGICASNLVRYGVDSPSLKVLGSWLDEDTTQEQRTNIDTHLSFILHAMGELESLHLDCPALPLSSTFLHSTKASRLVCFHGWMAWMSWEESIPFPHSNLVSLSLTLAWDDNYISTGEANAFSLLDLREHAKLKHAHLDLLTSTADYDGSSWDMMLPTLILPPTLDSFTIFVEDPVYLLESCKEEFDSVQHMFPGCLVLCVPDPADITRINEIEWASPQQHTTLEREDVIVLNPGTPIGRVQTIAKQIVERRGAWPPPDNQPLRVSFELDDSERIQQLLTRLETQRLLEGYNEQ